MRYMDAILRDWELDLSFNLEDVGRPSDIEVDGKEVHNEFTNKELVWFARVIDRHLDHAFEEICNRYADEFFKKGE